MGKRKPAAKQKQKQAAAKPVKRPVKPVVRPKRRWRMARVEDQATPAKGRKQAS